MRAYRIFARKHAKTAFTGGGARLNGGRWNSPGTAVVYASATLALGILEMLANAGSRMPPDLVYCSIDIPDDVKLDVVPAKKLPPNWYRYPAPPQLQEIGDRWVQRGRSLGLIVPSAVARIENNVLLNPLHPDFARLRIARPLDLNVDERFARRLKKRERNV